MEISLRQFHLGEIGHTQKVAFPKATAIFLWVNRECDRTYKAYCFFDVLVAVTVVGS